MYTVALISPTHLLPPLLLCLVFSSRPHLLNLLIQHFEELLLAL